MKINCGINKTIYNNNNEIIPSSTSVGNYAIEYIGFNPMRNTDGQTPRNKSTPKINIIFWMSKI